MDAFRFVFQMTEQQHAVRYLLVGIGGGSGSKSSSSGGSDALEEAKLDDAGINPQSRKILARNLLLRFRQFRDRLAGGGSGGGNRASGRGRSAFDGVGMQLEDSDLL